MSSQGPIADVQQILITHELASRPAHRSRPAEENRAMQALIGAMATGSEAVLSAVVTSALRLCRAGSTGISLIEEDPREGAIFRWVALAGAYSGFAGGHTPRNWSPCGVCLAHRAPVLVSHPARVFTYFQGAEPPIVEGLVVPVSYADEDLGTLWIVSHDDVRKFDREDARVMSNLANATAVALHLQRSKNN